MDLDDIFSTEELKDLYQCAYERGVAARDIIREAVLADLAR